MGAPTMRHIFLFQIDLLLYSTKHAHFHATCSPFILCIQHKFMYTCTTEKVLQNKVVNMQIRAFYAAIN